jgi:hypothetical protein
MREEVVYFILDSYSNSVKIGYSTIKGLKKRVENLQIGTPYELKLLGIVWGDKNIEKELHKKFKHSRIRGEWFYYTKELEEYLNESWDFSTIESLEKKMLKKLTNKPSEVNYDK